MVLLQALIEVQSAEAHRRQAEELAETQLQNEIDRAGDKINLFVAIDPENNSNQTPQKNRTFSLGYIQEETKKIMVVVEHGSATLKTLLSESDINRSVRPPKQPPEPPIVEDPLSAAKGASVHIEEYLRSLYLLRDQIVADFARERLVKKIVGWSMVGVVVFDIFLILRSVYHW